MRGQQPDGHRLEGDFEDLGWFEIHLLLGDAESSFQDVSWIILSCFELYLCGTGSFLSSVASVVPLLQTLAACGSGCDNDKDEI